MTTQTKITLEEYRKKMSGYVGLLVFRYVNLCIKAEPASLLSMVVVSEDGMEKIEDVVTVFPCSSDYQMELHVKDNEKLIPLRKGLFREHPEFKVQVFKADDDKEAKLPDDLDHPLYLLLTMPEVDKNRYDLLKDAANTFYNEAEVNIEKITPGYTKRLQVMAKNDSAEDKAFLQKQIDDAHDLHKDKIKEIRDRKLRDIEDAYKHYQESGQTSQVDDSKAGKTMKL